MGNRARMDIRHCFVPNLPGIIEIEEKQEGREGGEIEEKQEGRGGGGGERGGGGEGQGEKEGGGEGEDNMKSKEESDCESTKRVVIMAKHLCGVATDLALRSLESFKIQNTATSGNFLINIITMIVISIFYWYLLVCIFFTRIYLLFMYYL